MADSGELFAETIPEDEVGDLEMGGEDVVVEIDAGGPFAENGEQEQHELPFQGEDMEDVEDTVKRVTYVDYLKSPIISLLVGQGDEQALLTAHQALLVTSPWFAEHCARFSDDVSVCQFHITQIYADENRRNVRFNF